MGTFWDIRPPKQRPKPINLSKTRKRDRNNSSFFIIVLVVGIIAIFYFNATESKNLKGDNSVKSIHTPTTTSPEIDTNTENIAELQIKLLNGSGRTEETPVIQTLIENSGFKVAKTENALNIYDSTIIYYKDSKEKSANKLTSILEKYNPKIQKFTQDTAYDIIVVIGPK